MFIIVANQLKVFQKNEHRQKKRSKILTEEKSQAQGVPQDSENCTLEKK